MDYPFNIYDDSGNAARPQKKGKNPFSFLGGFRRLSMRHSLRLVPAEQPTIDKSFLIGVDFGTTAVKVVQLGTINKRLQVINLFVEELPWELWNAPLERKKAATDIFARIARENGLKGRVVTSLPASEIDMKIFKLPPMPDKEIRPALQWELKQSSPVAIEDLAFDYYTLGGSNDLSSKEIEVMVTSCPKKEVVERINIIKAARLIPYAVEMDALSALFSLTHNLQIKHDDIAVLLEFGCSSCSASVIINNRVCFKRTLGINGNSLTQAVAQHCKIASYQDAERLKQTYGLIDLNIVTQESSSADADHAIKVNEALWLHLETLIQEIDYTFKYFLHQLSEGSTRRFNRIVLSGGSALLKNFCLYLNTYLGVHVEIADPLRNIPLGPAVKMKYATMAPLLPQLSAAVGLALREIQE